MAKANDTAKSKELDAKKVAKNGAETGKAKAKDSDKAQKAKAQSGKSGSGVGEKIAQFREFFEESKAEMKKVTWPTRRETITTSVAVLVLVILMSLFLGVVDLGLSKLVEYILSA